jgi:hypothetical protein
MPIGMNEVVMNDTMKAVQLHAFGGPQVLRYEDAPKPVAAPGEVLVQVHAASLNPPDLFLRDGYRALGRHRQYIFAGPGIGCASPSFAGQYSGKDRACGLRAQAQSVR